MLATALATTYEAYITTLRLEHIVFQWSFQY
jgi:hypothetical protein